MSQQILHPQYRDQLRPTTYPFADAATLLSDDGSFIPASLFEDAILYPPGVNEQLYLSTIVVGNDAVEFHVATLSGALAGTAISQLFDPLQPALAVVDDYGRQVGCLVSSIEELSSFQSWAPGTYTFQPSQTLFAAGVCIPTPGVGVRGILLDDGTLFTGDVWLVGGDGVILRNETVEVNQDCSVLQVLQGIRIDVVGDPLFRRRLCADFETPQMLQELVLQYGCERFSLKPDSNGNVVITAGSRAAADSVLRIRTNEQGVIISAAGKSIAE